ncbi:HIT-like protein [Thelephora ganbajun]|uniref:HIT-like protein n=1 Tax=Thelephora ganbajun TaxID=370292 RepID=A0ACB6ZG30_THEGA|nr:HIT-like protein [Thelephora ganbajun]
MDWKAFKFERILNQDPASHAISFLGTLPNPEGAHEPAIIRIEKTALPKSSAKEFAQIIHDTEKYSWYFGRLKSIRDVKINVIFPATEVHIRKYSQQDIVLIQETPELYERVVKPFIATFPPSRTKWVDEIIAGRKEVDKVLHRDDSGPFGYMIIPDMKWNLETVSDLYLLALCTSNGIKSLRDLRKVHVPVLRNIRDEATNIVKTRWKNDGKDISLRMFVHYQPSYYHFHIHIVNANHPVGLGMAVGQAHLLDDIISLLELDPDDGPSIIERMTFTYGLGEQHGLYPLLIGAG